MDNIFESLKTFTLTKEDIENNTIIIDYTPWNKGLPSDMHPNSGRKFNKEWRKKMSLAKLGKKRDKFTAEHCKKLSDFKKGKRPRILVSRLSDRKVVDIQNFYRHN